MDIELIKKEISKNKVINKLVFFEELPSTQIYAKENSKNIKNGTIILANNQTRGIGTKDRKWYSKENENLTFTIVLKPNEKINKFEYLTIRLAETIIHTINNFYNIRADIKVPNDIIINNRKVCGILTETEVKGENVENLFIGIGLNVNQKDFDIEIKNIATSLFKETNKMIDKEYILINLISEIDKMLKNN